MDVGSSAMRELSKERLILRGMFAIKGNVGVHVVHIIRAIVHEIPKGRYAPEGPVQVGLSSAESQLAPQTRRFIEENMLDFSLKNPREIREDTVSASTTPGHVRSILADAEANFVSASQNIARNLHQSQTGNSPSGILIVAVVGTEAAKSLIIMKAEHQEGMRLQRVGDQATGHFDLEHLNELIVGNNSRVYKIAHLQRDGELLSGQMVDQQNGVAFADFFVSAFLGCRLSDDAEIQTRQFMKSSFDFVNNQITDEEKQGRYATALIAYISSPASTFQASEFAGQFLDSEDRDDYVRALPETLAHSVMNKNLALVPGQGSGLRLYGAGVVVSASAAALERGALEIVSEENGQTVVRITGSLKKFGLGTAPKE